MKEGEGTSRSVYAQLGARNYAKEERETNDYYATDPKAMELLLKEETFSHQIWEPACGEGHLSKVLKAHGYDVLSSDLIDRGYGDGGANFLSIPASGEKECDIITNPPYRYAQEFVEHSLNMVSDGHKVAMFLKIQFLEGKARRKLFDAFPPKTVYVSSSRLHCAMNGDFVKYAKSSPICYAWFVWEKGYTGECKLRWIN